MNEIDYKSEVRKVFPDAKCVWLPAQDEYIIRENKKHYSIAEERQHKKYISNRKNTQQEAWKSAYSNLPHNQNKEK